MLLAQDGELHQAHVQSTFQAHMRELEFRIDDTVKDASNSGYTQIHGCAPPLYIDKYLYGEGHPGDIYGRFEQVINDAVLHRCCGHDCRDSSHAHDVAVDELQ